MDKKEFRDQQINKLIKNDATSNVEQIRNYFLESSEVKQAKTISITLSHGFELDTSSIIKELQKMQKTVVIPRTLADYQMEFVEYNSDTKLEPKYFGILEPQNGRVVDAQQIELIVVPGLAYDTTHGNRLGFGGGYYDRYLKNSMATKIVLAFGIQVYDNALWDVNDYDINVDKIITEEGIVFDVKQSLE